MSVIKVFSGEPSTLDPGLATEHDGVLILRFLADPLVDHTPDGKHARPAAARSWAVDDDGRRIIFHLREDVRFHHGRAVTAEDYVYSLARVARPSTGSQLAYNLAVIQGYEEVRAGRNQWLRGVRSLDAHTLEITLNESFHEIPRLFSHRLTSAVPRELVEADRDAFARQPVSTGPYRLAGPFHHRGPIELHRFDAYYGANEAFADGGSGLADQLRFIVYDDVAAGVADWREGHLDVVKLPPSMIAQAFTLGECFQRTPCALLQYLGFPVDIPPFDAPEVRQGIAMCIDRQKIIDSVFDGTRPLADRIIPPAIDPLGATQDLIGVPFDPVRGRAVLARALGHGGVELDFHFNAGLGHEAWVEIMTAQLREHAGIVLRPAALPWPQFIRWLERPMSLFRMTWAMDYPSVDNFLFPLFHSSGHGQDNLTRFTDERVDRLIEQARSTQDDRLRAQRYRQAESLACQQLPLLPLWFGVQYHLLALDRIEVLDALPIDAFGEPTLRSYRPRHLDPVPKATAV